ncbi:Ribose-phosphate pyrophosphokinase [Brevibacterium casei]|uniref:Ribose-phosphate pyrophosphokinase n=1 Tax=Brevibacterium casei TaxID=33889 RepID=A0A449D1L0_9MICO|nr:Ribose-phosphate pyrophosphokinase [Brevibacterium casei]
MEQLIMVDALKRASAKRITVIAPFFPYARQDKKHRGREPISARLVADLYKTAGADRIITVDLHTAQIQATSTDRSTISSRCPSSPATSRTSTPATSPSSRPTPAASRSPRTGRTPSAACPWPSSTRPATSRGRTRRRPTASSVRSKAARASSSTTLIDTGGTIVQAADACMAAGAKNVIVVSTHAVFSGPAVERLSNSVADEVIVTNTLPLTGGQDLRQAHGALDRPAHRPARSTRSSRTGRSPASSRSETRRLPHRGHRRTPAPERGFALHWRQAREGSPDDVDP